MVVVWWWCFGGVTVVVGMVGYVVYRSWCPAYFVHRLAG